STTTGSAPSSTQARVMAAPMPLAPPVMTMTLSLSCKSIKSGCIQPKDLLFLDLGEIAHVIADHFLYLGVARSQQAYRPVRSKHQAINPECCKDNVEIWIEVGRLPTPPIRFYDHS